MSGYCVAESWSCRASSVQCHGQSRKEEEFRHWSLQANLFEGHHLVSSSDY